MKMRCFDAKPLTDFLERYAVAVDAQGRTEVRIVRFVWFLAIEETPQCAKHLGLISVIHSGTDRFPRTRLTQAIQQSQATLYKTLQPGCHSIQIRSRCEGGSRCLGCCRWRRELRNRYALRRTRA